MGKIKNFFGKLNCFGVWLDRIIFARFSENYIPAEYPVLLPFCSGIFWGIVLVIFMFFGGDNHSGFNNLFFRTAILSSTALNVMLHVFQIEKLPSVKTKLGYLVFISVLSYFVTALIVALIGWAVVLAVVCFILLVFGCSVSTSSPPEYYKKLPNGDSVKRYANNIWINKHGWKYVEDKDGQFRRV